MQVGEQALSKQNPAMWGDAESKQAEGYMQKIERTPILKTICESDEYHINENEKKL
jgi:hypothetical protein